MAEADGAIAAADPRRLRQRCLWALVIVLPVAFAVRGWENALEWWRAQDLFAQRIAMDAPTALGGAEWRIGSFQNIAERRNGSVVILLELEAVVRDPDEFGRLPCRVAVTDDRGRRWTPGFLTPSEVRRLPSVRDRPAATCNAAVASKPVAGATLAIRESFTVPRGTFETLDVTLSLPAERPRYLRFARNP